MKTKFALQYKTQNGQLGRESIEKNITRKYYTKILHVKNNLSHKTFCFNSFHLNLFFFYTGSYRKRSFA